MSRRSLSVAALAVILLGLHALLALRGVAEKNITVDEIFHVTGGYCFNVLGDYRVHPDNGVLPQRLHALPAVLSGAKPPPTQGNEFWHQTDVGVISHQFFYEVGNDHQALLRGARRMNLLFSLGIGLMVFFWARHLAGDLAGIVALALAAFSPTLLAHGPLATTDASAALLLPASCGAFWWHLRRPGRMRLALSSLLFALACVSKFSAVLLVPIFLGLTVLHLVLQPRDQRRLGLAALSLALHAVAAWLIIWAAFGFRFSAFAPGSLPTDQFVLSWEWLLDRAGWQGQVLRQIRDHRLLPEGFLLGYTQTYVGSLSRAAYLAGDFSIHGWRQFFPLAFLWKSTPVELLVVPLAAIVLFFRAKRSPWVLVRLAPLLILLLVYGAVAIKSQLNIGHRHLLPLYPVLFIGGGVAVALLTRGGRPATVLPAIIVGGQLVAAVTIFPHYLAYFNPLAGGPANGWRLLVDSSLDWGQDLAGLKRWLDENNTAPAQPVFLSYFGSGEPDALGLKVRRLPFINGFKTPHYYVRLESGLYCISATTLVQVYSPWRGPWTLEREQEYLRLRALEPLFAEYDQQPLRRAELQREAPPEKWLNAWTRHDQLRFARLCHYLRVRPPDTTIGHSIFVFRLSEGEVAAATAGSIADWQRLIERASAGPK